MSKKHKLIDRTATFTLTYQPPSEQDFIDLRPEHRNYENLCRYVGHYHPAQIALHPRTLLLLAGFARPQLPPIELWENYAKTHTSPCNLLGVPVYFDLALAEGDVVFQECQDESPIEGHEARITYLNVEISGETKGEE